ncbi:UNVERIFIED_CONTAM: hypothetical protein K2H54_016513 [Gekko kuhli]
MASSQCYVKRQRLRKSAIAFCFAPQTNDDHHEETEALTSSGWRRNTQSGLCVFPVLCRNLKTQTYPSPKSPKEVKSRKGMSVSDKAFLQLPEADRMPQTELLSTFV